LNRLESTASSPRALTDSVSRLNAIADSLQAQEAKPRQQQEELLARLDRLAAGIPVHEDRAHDELALQEEQIAFIRELAHSLNTPLSQIEAAALLLQEDLKQENSANADSRSSASRIYQSAEICKAFLSGFMQITKVASQTSRWNPKSLEESLTAATELYAETSNPQVKSSVRINAEPVGYPTSYTLAVALPLLENAFEAARPGTTVIVEITAERNEYRINVTSASDKIPEGDSMYESGFTTKTNHQGLGLSVVRRLLSAYQGATITHTIEGDKISFHVSLPRGQHE
jgi:K+-sensing histidine kinase KdpD